MFNIKLNTMGPGVIPGELLISCLFCVIGIACLVVFFVVTILKNQAKIERAKKADQGHDRKDDKQDNGSFR